MVPLMQSNANLKPLHSAAPVQIAIPIGTILARELFWRIGGYDAGMMFYGAAEPEFSIRAWLTGAEILSISDLKVAHQSKSRAEKVQRLDSLLPYLVQNRLRFGMLYLSDLAILQMVRHYSMTFPNHQVQKAFALVNSGDVWQRKQFLQRALPRDFNWFIQKFDIKDQIGREILRN
jgi:hypothetical protein